EHAAEERGERHDEDGGDHEAGGDPGDLLDGGAERTAQVRDGDVDDRRVDRAHQRPEGHRDGDQPLVDRWTIRHVSLGSRYRPAPRRKRSTSSSTCRVSSPREPCSTSFRITPRTMPSSATACSPPRDGLSAPSCTPRLSTRSSTLAISRIAFDFLPSEVACSHMTMVRNCRCSSKCSNSAPMIAPSCRANGSRADSCSRLSSLSFSSALRAAIVASSSASRSWKWL